MDTFFARNRLSAYLDGSLPEAEAAEVEAAIAEDPGLRDEFDSMRQAVELLRTVGPAEAPEGFHARLMARIDEEPAPTGVVALFRRVTHRVPVEALALAAAALIVVLVIQGRDQDDVPDDVLAAAAEYERGADVEPPSSVESPPPATEIQAEEAPAQLAQAEVAQEAQGPAPSADGDLRTSSGSLAGTGNASSAAAASTSKLASRSSADSAPPERAKDIEVPEQPYVADWEQQGVNVDPDLDATDTPAELYEGIEMARPLAYRIALADSEILYQLSAAAESAGGRLTDASGNSFRARELGPDDSWMKVNVVVPRDAATGVQGAIGRMGGVPTPPPADTLMYGADYAVFVVELTHQP